MLDDQIADSAGKAQSRTMLRRLLAVMAEHSAGQIRLDRVAEMIAEEMKAGACSVYLERDDGTLELCAAAGLDPSAVHKVGWEVGQGLVGRVAGRGKPVNVADARATPGFVENPDLGDEAYSSFLGVPVERLGKTYGVLAVQSANAAEFVEDDVYATELVAMVIAELVEHGAFAGGGEEAMESRRDGSVQINGTSVQEGAADGHVWLHESRVVVTNLIAEDPRKEIKRLNAAMEDLREGIDRMVETASEGGDKEQLEVLEAYRMFAHSKGWTRRIEEDIARGLSAEASVEKEQYSMRTKMARATDPYIRYRLHDLDDLANRLLRILTGQGQHSDADMPSDPILIARNIGPAELLDYGSSLRAVVLEEGSVGSHAAIVARALSIPLVIHADRISTEAHNGDYILVDGDEGSVQLRPDNKSAGKFQEVIRTRSKARERFAAIRDLPAETQCGKTIGMIMNAGLMEDFAGIEESGAEGVGLFRTELQFLTADRMPRRAELSEFYAQVLEAANGKRVVFRTLDIGSDKVLSYMKPVEEPNPALGWRAVRVAQDKPGIMRMQLQALVRAANGRPLSIMFPLVSQHDEFSWARAQMDKVLEREKALERPVPESVEIGAMLETPSLAFAPDQFFAETDFISIGGNDLKQFFFAADRENELVRKRFDTLNVSFLSFLERVAERCAASKTRLSFCGEDAGRPVEAACFAAIGIHNLSMRPTSIGPVKALLRQISLDDLRKVLHEARAAGMNTARGEATKFLSGKI